LHLQPPSPFLVWICVPFPGHIAKVFGHQPSFAKSWRVGKCERRGK
jgi:hypothetical protein